MLALALDGDPLELDRAELERQRKFLADAEGQAAGGGRANLVVGARGHVVGADREERSHEGARRGGPHGGAQRGLAVGELDDRSGDGGAGRVANHAADHAGGGLRLGGGGVGRGCEKGGGGRQEDDTR